MLLTDAGIATVGRDDGVGLDGKSPGISVPGGCASSRELPAQPPMLNARKADPARDSLKALHLPTGQP